ncbi:MAG: hypothetical protein K0R39_825 [Symbiobacteriaceae bacterium]|jgi:hypothetical protein|nr:hypothetical protein [Symbiobacteriaceae bacterium]
MPVYLLLDRRIGARARVLYGMLQALPKFCAEDQTGRFTHMVLSRLAGAGINTVKRSLLELAAAEWLRICQRHKRAPIEFVLVNPQAVAADAWVKKAQWRIKRAKHKGEAIMQEYLTLLIDSMEYQDNVKVGVLINPWTGERMEFDRYYPHVAAFEFQGPHHDGNTDQFTEKEVRSQEARDLMKRGICAKEGIALVEVRREELSLSVMKQKVGTLLTLRDLTGLEKVVRYLEGVGKSYRA